MKTEDAPDVRQLLESLVDKLNLSHVDSQRIICFRSRGSTSRAIARIWSLPKIWQSALKVKAHYIVEVCSERYDKLSHEDKTRTLIHELLHIPKNFSGATVSHNAVHFDGKGGHVRKRIDMRTVEKLFVQLKSNVSKEV